LAWHCRQRLPWHSRQRLPRVRFGRLTGAAGLGWRLVLQADRLFRDGRRQRRSDGSRSGRSRARLRGSRGRRRHGGGLTAPVRNGDRVGHIVDHDGIVHVVEDHIIGRWRRHIARWRNPDGDRPIDRHRQDKQSHRRRRRRQDHELRRRRRQEEDRSRRRRSESKFRVVENQKRPSDEHDLFVRRRGQVVSQ
jgi:hypothetical protein